MIFDNKHICVCIYYFELTSAGVLSLYIKMQRGWTAAEQILKASLYFPLELFCQFPFPSPSLCRSCKYPAVTPADLVGLGSWQNSVFVSTLFYKYEIRAMADPMCGCVVNWDLASVTPVYAPALHTTTHQSCWVIGSNVARESEHLHRLKTVTDWVLSKSLWDKLCLMMKEVSLGDYNWCR